MKQIRAHYSLEHFHLEDVRKDKIAAADGEIIEGAFRWHAILADRRRGRRGSIDLVMPISGGAPVGSVQVLANGQPIPFTVDAIDQHLNIRRNATRSSHRLADADLSFIEE